MRRHPVGPVMLLGASFMVFGLTALLGACDDETTRPNPCWMGLDTLYASGIAVTDTNTAREAFEAYIAVVDSTDAAFPSESQWQYLSAHLCCKYEGSWYWSIRHRAYLEEQEVWLVRRLTYVSERGVIVWPLGCI